MIEIQCTSCHTRYRIDERVLPDDTPTFKCSRCGHVFNADPVPARVRKPAPPAADNESQPARTLRPARPRPSALKSHVESDVVKRSGDLRPQQPTAETEVRPSDREPVERATFPAPLDAPDKREDGEQSEVEADNPLNRQFGDREQKPDTGENLKFVFSDARNRMAGDAPPEHELERPDPDDGGWQVGETPPEFEPAPMREAPIMMAEPEPAPRPTPTPVRRMAAPLIADAPRYAPPPQRSAGFQFGQADDRADAVSPGGVHSSGVFLAIFFFVAIFFLGASAFISDEPAASARVFSQAPQIGDYFARPIVPAMLVTLRDVRSEYYALKGGHVALVITGNAQNVGSRPLHLVQIDADLIGAGPRPLASQSVACGNELSAKMLAEMTPREIEFSQGLSPPKAFAMDPSASAPFLMVFIDPPTGAGKIRIAVSKAAPVADSIAAAPPPA
jgi:predicted Zn finger-like uncharacterized protein